MVAAFPAAKLGALLLKQISKPLANVVKSRAKTSPFFRNYICMPPAQFYHWCEVRMRMWTMNLGKPVKIPKMNEANAIELGAELVGETVIFSIAAAILVAEYVRSSRKEAAKEAERKEELQRIQSELKELYFAKAKLETEVNELVRVLHVDIKVPQSAFKPDYLGNEESIPVHHREDVRKEEEGGIFSGISDLVWDAVELLFPSADDSPQIKVEQPVSVVSSPASPIPSPASPIQPPNSTSAPAATNSTTSDQIKSQDNTCSTQSKPGGSASAATSKR